MTPETLASPAALLVVSSAAYGLAWAFVLALVADASRFVYVSQAYFECPDASTATYLTPSTAATIASLGKSRKDIQIFLRQNRGKRVGLTVAINILTRVNYFCILILD